LKIGVFRALPNHPKTMKIITLAPLFLLDQKKSAKKIKASCRYQVQYSPISAMPYRTIFTLVRHFSIRYGHAGECHDGSHFLHLFGLPMFGSQPILRNAPSVQSAFAHRFPICSMG
jgi:hypothetical protein